MTAAVTALAAMQRAAPDPIAAAGELGVLLDLPALGLGVRGARVFGSGSAASAEILISNGEVMAFETLRDMTSPAVLSAELVACTGATPKITRQQALRAVALLRALAEREATATDNDIAVEWGVSYLQAADVVSLDMNDQGERWAEFSRLNEIHPWSLSRDRSCALAAAGTVLRHVDGTRFVRCGWFYAHVRTLEASVSQQQVGKRMARVGWMRRGTAGRIKATPPGRRDQLAWSFFVVPAGWEESAQGGTA